MLVLMDLMICESRSCSSIVSGLLSLGDILCQKSVEKNTSQGSYLSTSATPRLTLKNLHTIPYNKIIRNSMELSGILTVQSNKISFSNKCFLRLVERNYFCNKFNSIPSLNGFFVRQLKPIL